MFDFIFFVKEEVVDKYTNLPYKNEIFTTDKIIYNHKKKILLRNNEDFSFKIDFNQKKIFVKLLKDDFEGNMTIYYSKVIENNNIITIIYQVDKNEPVNKIIITRRKNEG